MLGLNLPLWSHASQMFSQHAIPRRCSRMTPLQRYPWLLLRFVRLCGVFALTALGVVTVCVLAEGIGHMDWGYPQYSVPLARVLALGLVVWVIRSAAVRNILRLGFRGKARETTTPIFRVAGTGPLPPGVETDLSKLKVWWVSGLERTISGKKPFKVIAGKDFKAVDRTMSFWLFCRRDHDEILTIMSPEGVEMTEAEFRELWARTAQKNQDGKGAL
jgi:hypothetical protein